MSTITEIWLENRRGGSALGIDESAPRVTVIADGPAPDGFVLELLHDDDSVERAEVDEARLVAWPFRALEPRAGGRLRARVGANGPWSSPLRVERGIADGWRVDFVSPSLSASPETRAAHLLRAEFDIAARGIAVADIVRARAYVSAHGVYELELNGDRVSDERLAPGWTSYRHRLRHQTFDVSGLLRGGANVLGAWLADGWYRGHLGFDGGLWDIYGTDVALLLQLDVVTRDGRRHEIPLTWRHHASPILAAGLYEGESYDARLLPRGWSEPGFDDIAWMDAAVLDRSRFAAAIEPPTAPPVRETERLRPVDVSRREGGRIRLDFGQNISGVLAIRPRAPRGTVIRLHHAEVIEDGELGTRPLRGATSVDSYVCSGEAPEEYTPRFTIHGFRYAEIEGWVGELRTGDVEALVIHTDMQRTGRFASSSPELDRLHENVVWSMRDNFVDVPTDCPQRDERMGWTGDIQVFAPTALRLYAAHGVLTGWLRDVAAEQHDDGHVPQFVPWVECGFPNHPTAAWGDAAVIVPWEMYRNDGDATILREQYDSMRAWVDLVDRLTGRTGHWSAGFQLGDWLDPAAPPERPGDSRTDRYLVATAYHARTARIMAQVAAVLGREADAAHYEEVAARAAAAFRDEYVAPSGRVVSDTPTSIALALTFDLLASDEQRRCAGDRLLELVAQDGFHISTGFVGTPIICDALMAAGGRDHAYRLLMQRELPSWLYSVSMGATTIWERWDSMLPDGSINPGDMTSFNHYALGAVADFMHRVVAGLVPDAPGWRHIRFAPQPGGGLQHASASYDSVHGPAAIAWRRDGSTITIRATVPAGSSGTVVLPATGEEVAVGPGVHEIVAPCWSAADDITSSERTDPAPPLHRPTMAERKAS
ncbi:glycoside hydrolase family 78 protein [Agrococcus jenensis]|uniref:alpha-L-rhamnosidase n=1 Tax=Agrococcus jenensis TaxID=46353 RepID=A0A3N2AQC4_9MICO|nr:glycoside hydrolase family 78 protein [Agrococcus jenensis]ROR65196.1 alpha-L-rhamnosidase [Agrococcus jenensis]